MEHLLQVAREDLRMRRQRVFQQHLAIAFNRIHRRSEVMAKLVVKRFVVAVRDALGDRARVEQPVDQPLQRKTGQMNSLQIGLEPFESLARRVLQQDLGEADNCTDGRAKVLTDMGEQGAFQALVRMGVGRRWHLRSRTLTLDAQEARGLRRVRVRARRSFFRGGAEDRLAWYHSRHNRLPGPSPDRPTWHEPLARSRESCWFLPSP